MSLRKLALTDLKRLSVQEAQQAPKLPYVIILDNVRSMLNVGSIFRTADSFACTKLYLCGITGTPPHREIQKTALGSDQTVSWEYWPSTLDCVLHLQQTGYVCFALEQAVGSVGPDQLSYTGKPIGLVVGNEVNGVSQEVIEACGACIEIPQDGHKHSLNVSVATGILMWELRSLLIAHKS